MSEDYVLGHLGRNYLAMTVQKKDFIEIAKAIREADISLYEKAMIADVLSVAFTSLNPQFNKGLFFMAAVGIDHETWMLAEVHYTTTPTKGK